MKFIKSRRSPQAAESAAKVDRRSLVVGAGVAGAAATAAVLLQRGGVQPAPVAARARPVSEAGGYRLTPHVQRYYQTAKS